jgi:hypothetical protein
LKKNQAELLSTGVKAIPWAEGNNCPNTTSSKIEKSYLRGKNITIGD